MRKSGFSLLEVVVALGLLAGAVIGLSHLLLASASSCRDTRRSDLASALALERMEGLRALSWGYEADGTPREDTTTNVAGTGDPGPGVGLSPAGALDHDVPGFVDYLDADGRPVSGDRSAVASFVRRWAIESSPDGAGEALVLQVLVIRADARLHPAPARSRGAAAIATLKTRRTW